MTQLLLVFVLDVEVDRYIRAFGFVCSLSSVPKVQFKQAVMTAEESEGHITAVVHRSGDIRHKSTVRCYTRQGSAQVVSDFDERPNTDTSIVTFFPGK